MGGGTEKEWGRNWIIFLGEKVLCWIKSRYEDDLIGLFRFMVGLWCHFIGEIRVEPGHQSYPFECELPIGLPTSMEAKEGHIRYTVKVVFEVPDIVPHLEFVEVFTMIKPLNLNDSHLSMLRVWSRISDLILFTFKYPTQYALIAGANVQRNFWPISSVFFVLWLLQFETVTYDSATTGIRLYFGSNDQCRNWGGQSEFCQGKCDGSVD